MGKGCVLLQVVNDQVPVRALQILAALGQRPEIAPEDLDLQREVQQVVVQAILAEAAGGLLRVAVDTQLALVAHPCPVQASADLRVWKANHGSLVEVVDDLAVDAVAIDGHRLEVAVLQQRADDPRHVILRGLQCQEDRRVVRLGETGLSADQRPEQLDTAPRQAACGDQRRDAARPQPGAPQRLAVRPGQRPHRRHHQDRAGRDAALHQVQQPLHARGGLARAGRPIEEDGAVEGRSADGPLGPGQVHSRSWHGRHAAGTRSVIALSATSR